MARKKRLKTDIDKVTAQWTIKPRAPRVIALSPLNCPVRIFSFCSFLSFSLYLSICLFLVFLFFFVSSRWRVILQFNNRLFSSLYREVASEFSPMIKIRDIALLSQLVVIRAPQYGSRDASRNLPLTIGATAMHFERRNSVIHNLFPGWCCAAVTQFIIVNANEDSGVLCASKHYTLRRKLRHAITRHVRFAHPVVAIIDILSRQMLSRHKIHLHISLFPAWFAEYI